MIWLLVLLGWLGAEAGASFPWSAKWQKFKGLNLTQAPEIALALIFTYISNTGIESFYDLSWLETLNIALIIYAGIQSATWMFLKWDDGDKNPNTKRGSTTKPLVDWIAEQFGWKLGDEGYSWTAATVKGTIITLPMGGLGGIFFALGYEVGSHAKGRVPFNSHIIPEALSFLFVGAYYLLALWVCQYFGGA